MTTMLWIKLLSFAELMLGIFFIVVFGSIIMGLFLTEKETLEQKDYADEKQQLFGPLLDLFGPVVHRIGELFKDVDFKPLESPVTTMSLKPTRKLVISLAFPNSSRFKGSRIILPCSRVKDFIEVLPTDAKEKLFNFGLSPDKITRMIEEGTSGAVSTIEWTGKKGTKVIVDVSVQES